MPNTRTLLLAVALTLAGCLSSSEPGDPAADAGPPNDALEDARAECVESCGAILAAEECTTTDQLAAQADRCRAECADQLEGAAECSSAGAAMWRCLGEARWYCVTPTGGAEPVPGSCQVEAEALRKCLIGGAS